MVGMVVPQDERVTLLAVASVQGCRLAANLGYGELPTRPLARALERAGVPRIGDSAPSAVALTTAASHTLSHLSVESRGIVVHAALAVPLPQPTGASGHGPGAKEPLDNKGSNCGA